MRTITILILLIFIAAGCGGGTSTSGGNSNPNNGKTATPAGTGSKLGSSGGFVDVDGDGIADLVIGAPNASISSNLGLPMYIRVIHQAGTLLTLPSP